MSGPSNANIEDPFQLANLPLSTDETQKLP